MVTILTSPVIFCRFISLKIIIKRLYKIILRVITLNMNDKYKYTGHTAVTKSLIQGMKKSDKEFIYNPLFINEKNKIIIVLAGIETLKQMINLKRRGSNFYLIAGPNIVTYSDDFDSMIGSEYIDIVITPSNWVKVHYEAKCISLIGKTFPWAAGVDKVYWRPNKDQMNSKNQNIIFKKVIKLK